jgi:hypothetical protein
MIQDVRPSCHKLSQGVKPGSSIRNLILSGSQWNDTTSTFPRKKKLSAHHQQQKSWLLSFVMRKVLFFKLLAYGNSILTTILKH